MMFIVFGDRSNEALCRFETTGKLPSRREREKLERDLAEINEKRERVLAILKAPQPKRGKRETQRA